MGRVVNATPRPLYARERRGTHCKGGWVGPRAELIAITCGYWTADIMCTNWRGHGIEGRAFGLSEERGVASKIMIGRLSGERLRGRSRHRGVVRQLISGRLGTPAVGWRKRICVCCRQVSIRKTLTLASDVFQQKAIN